MGKPILLSTTDDRWTVIYDDEGNIYGNTTSHYAYNKIRADIGNSGTHSATILDGVPVKVRVYIDDVDEFATEFIRFNLGYGPYYLSPTRKIECHNIPIPKE